MDISNNNRAQKHLGICEDFIEAVAHRLAGEQAINWSGCDSTSPAYLFMICPITVIGKVRL